MKISLNHSWDLTNKQATNLQSELASRLMLQNCLNLKSLSIVAAADAAYSKQDKKIHAAVLVFSYPSLSLIEEAQGSARVIRSYLPGLLAFREGPLLLELFSQIKNTPQVVFFDGQGIAHPRGFGLASHLGMLLGVSSIGCAKTALVGSCSSPANRFGATAPILYKNKKVGVALKTRKKVKPIFISVGNKIDLKRAVSLTLKCCRGFRMPEPLRQAHITANRIRQRAQHQEEVL